MHVSPTGPWDLEKTAGNEDKPPTLVAGKLIGKNEGHQLSSSIWCGISVEAALLFSEMNNNRGWCTEDIPLYIYAFHPSNWQWHLIKQQHLSKGVLGKHCEFVMKSPDAITPDTCWEGKKCEVSGMYSWTKLYDHKNLFSDDFVAADDIVKV
jgi:hypothetical protein